MNVKNILVVILMFITNSILAQTPQPEMADIMRSNGKIYVVVGVLAIIFASIIVYLFMIDKKIGRIEKSINQKSKVS